MKRPRGRPPHADLLTPSEWRTVHAVQHGMTNAEIARRRGVSVERGEISHRQCAGEAESAQSAGAAGLVSRAEGQRPGDQGEPPWNKSRNSGRSGRSRGRSATSQVSETWYREVLGLPHLYTFGTLAFFDCGGTRLMLSQEGGAAKESILYLRVPDIAAAHEQACGARREVHARAAHDSPPRRWHRRVDGVLRGSGWPAAGVDVSGGWCRAPKAVVRRPPTHPERARPSNYGFWCPAPPYILLVSNRRSRTPANRDTVLRSTARRNLCRASRQPYAGRFHERIE